MDLLLYVFFLLRWIYSFPSFRIHSQGMKRSKDHPDSRAIFYEDETYNKRKVEDFLSALGGFEKTVEIVQLFEDLVDECESELLINCVSVSKGKFPDLKESLEFFSVCNGFPSFNHISI